MRTYSKFSATELPQILLFQHLLQKTFVSPALLLLPNTHWVSMKSSSTFNSSHYEPYGWYKVHKKVKTIL
jgi:hypothetical protein